MRAETVAFVHVRKTRALFGALCIIRDSATGKGRMAPSRPHICASFPELVTIYQKLTWNSPVYELPSSHQWRRAAFACCTCGTFTSVFLSWLLWSCVCLLTMSPLCQDCGKSRYGDATRALADLRPKFLAFHFFLSCF